MKPQIIAGVARAGNVIESVVSGVRTGRFTCEPQRARVVAYRGLGNSSRLTVRGRVVRQAQRAASGNGHGNAGPPAHVQLVAVYRAFDAEELTGVTVHATSGASSATVSTDTGGYFKAELQPGASDGEWSAGWHRVTLRCGFDDVDVSTDAEVFVPDVRARLLLVSDLDDTAMDSETLNNWRMLRNILFRHASRRRPIPGVPELYSALHRGQDGISNPVCYISSGAWNLYDMVVEYLDTHGLPRGGMYLNDWGSRARRFQTVAHGHKRTYVGALMKQFPTLPLLLVGDDTQEDPELYAQAALENPGRVGAIWIRRVRRDQARTAQVEALVESMRAVDVDVVYAESTSAFAADATRRGWIDECQTCEAVREG